MKSANQMTALPSWLGAGATWSLARAAIVLALAASSSARADIVTDWNATALGLTTLSPPPAELRALAITHAAMFDAINAITRSHAPYLVQPTAPADSSADAAAASAAHGVLRWLFPGAKTPLDAALAASLGKLADGAAKDGGLALGREVAGKYITARTGDGIDRKPDYRAGSGVGVFQPVPPGNFGSVIWADVKPFVLASAGEVTAPGPLAFDSAQYAKELDEVRRLGGRDSRERSADQTAAAIFSMIKPAQLFAPAARAAVSAKGSSVVDNARTFALMHMAATDAYIAGWAIKKQHAVWRPEAAIRQGASNPDPKWQPLLNTPDHPDYVSGHCSTSGASAQVLRMILGNDGVPFTATMGGNLTRSYQNLTQAELEIGDARVWAGIHTRTADEHGGIMGRNIGELAVQRLMKPLPKVAENRGGAVASAHGVGG